MPYKFGPTWNTIQMRVLPCFYCGQGLPSKLMEVDHWFEQKKGGRIGLAQVLLKVFRALGLTEEGSTGRKGAQFQLMMKNEAVNTIEPRGRKIDATTKESYVNTLRTSFWQKKRQLNLYGIMMLSILVHATKLSKNQESFFEYF